MNARPSRQEFGRLAAAHRVVPVWRELLADLITPVAAFSRIVGDDLDRGRHDRLLRELAAEL